MSTNPLALIAEPDFKPHWVESLSNEAYHADSTSVSSTGIRKVLRSPARFKRECLDGKAPAPTATMNLGTMAHAAILEGEKFFGRYAVMPRFEGIGMKARKADWLIENANREVITQVELDQIRGMVEAISTHPDAVLLLKNAAIETSGFFRDEETGIRCRLRPDVMNFDLMALVDLKTTKNAESYPFSKAIWDYRYDIQIATYGEGAAVICGKPVDYHVIIAVESSAPYECAVYTCAPAVIARGQRDFHRGLRRLKECIEKNTWPRLQTRMEDIDLPPWTPPEDLS